MEITRIRIYPFDTGTRGGRIRAVADVELDGVLLIKGIRILEGRSGGLFLGMPAIRIRSGEFRDTIVITDKELAAHLRHRIVEAYQTDGLEPGPGQLSEQGGHQRNEP
ncbi:SpoVG family protein [bacterium]|nr:SpoVG family protein [candidate division CSSED10-310 bacterium]